jgi:hypothetical protein
MESKKEITIKSPKIEVDERAAMRAYLQRAEVRLSTMHRVAGIFLNGAGLLFLFPVFFRDAFVRLISNIFAFTFPAGKIASLLMLLISLGIPLWALYLLIKDMVRFYFTAYHAGLRERFFHPRFILSGISFSEDESKYVKESVIASQQTKDMLSFIVPPDEKDQRDYRRILGATNGQIIPKKRRDYIPGDDDELKDDVKLFDTALGLAGVVDRTIIEEVAKMEMSLVRHAINLRHLVLRYSKALLLFLLTTVVFIIGAELIRIPEITGKSSGTNIVLQKTSKTDTDNETVYVQIPESIEPVVQTRQLLLLSSVFLVWAFLTPIIVTRPVAWIYRYAAKSLIQIRSDREIAIFERYVVILSIAVFCFASVFTAFYLAPQINAPDSIYYTVFSASVLSVVFICYWLWYLFFRSEEVGNSSEKIYEMSYNQLNHDNQSLNDNPPVPDTDEGTSTINELEASEYDLSLLHQQISRLFSDRELSDLFEKLSVDYDDFAVYGKSAKARELVFYLFRRSYIPELISVLKQERPRFNWESLKKRTFNNQ